MKRFHEIYMNKENRDRRFKELKEQGHRVRKSSRKNQLLHPQYVKDFEGPEKEDTGIGNNVYKTYFSTLYIIENQL